MAGETVLVVDDRKENVDFVVDYVLKPNGYKFLTARDGEEGLRLALSEKPDLILLDMQMPRMTGLEVLEALKKEGQEIPVVLMTFHGSESLAVQVFRLGVKDYVIKPFQAEEMLAAIERALAEVRLRRERDQLMTNLVRANSQLEQRVKELNTLYGIGKSVSSVLNLEQLLNRVVEAAVYITGAEEGSLLLIDEETNELYLRAAQGLEERFARGFRLKAEDSLAGWVIKTGQPFIIDGKTGDHKIVTAYLVKALLYTPLRVEDKIIGVLGVANHVSERTFNSHDLFMLSALADYAAVAIEKVRLFSEIQRQVRELTFFNEVGQTVTSTLDLPHVLTVILGQACQVLRVGMASIMLLDQESGDLVLRAAAGGEAKDIVGLRIPKGRGVAGWVAHHGQPQLVPDVQADPRFYRGVDEVVGYTTKSVLCVPLKIKDRVIGVVEALNKAEGGFTSDDLRLLNSLATYAAIAIENARLFEELEKSKEREKQHIRNLFQHYVAPVVVDHLIAGFEKVTLGGRRQEITILFADIRGFTSLSERMQPEKLVGVLNQYLSLAAQAVLDYEGTLDKFMGDAVMAFFNAPTSQPDHVERAVRAAIAMQRAIVAHCYQVEREMRLGFGVGISMGEAVVGNIGTAQLMNYTAIGDSVNLAKRLQEMAQAGQILLSQRAYERVKDAVLVRDLPPIQVKGRSAPEKVYELLGLKSEK
ncbi:MAG: GAF domain-containing protein [Anaerolineae bacterium]